MYVNHSHKYCKRVLQSKLIIVCPHVEQMDSLTQVQHSDSQSIFFLVRGRMLSRYVYRKNR